MSLHNLKSKYGARHRRKRVGRGNGSGMGTYSTRGMKGQKARSGGNVRPGFEGGQTPFVQRMPKLKGFRNPNQIQFQVVNVGDLEMFENDTEVTNTLLYEKGLIGKKNLPVKILGNGELSKKLSVKVDAASLSAVDKIKKAKGMIEVSKEAKAPRVKGNVGNGEKKEEKPENAEKVEKKSEKAEKPEKNTVTNGK